MSATVSAAGARSGAAGEERLLSLDAYRGLIMIALAFNGFGLAETAAAHLAKNPDSMFWQNVHYQFSHTEWEGCAFWDMIQPSFMFMVGVSMAYSYVKRQARGDSWLRMFGHALIRSIVLVLLGVFLSSMSSDATNWAFMNVLSQIGLGYVFLFLLWRRPLALQVAVIGLLLAVTWIGYDRYPTPGIDLETGQPSVGVSAEWAQENLAEIPPAWHKNANLGHAIDLVFLNFFPRSTPFTFNSGGYQTINFIPSLATMLIGLLCGELLRSSLSGGRKMLTLVAMAATGIGLGLVFQELDCPIVKRIWTPSWALYSAGWCCLILATLYGVIDLLGLRRWSFFLVVVGTNSIAVYMMGQMLRDWTLRRLKVHFGTSWPEALGPDYVPMLSNTAVGVVFWLVCYWMWRQRIFIRI